MAGAAPWHRTDGRRGALLVKKSGGVLKRPRRTHARKDAEQSAAFKSGLARRLLALGLPPDRPVRIWTMDEHRYGLISHQRRCWGLRRVRPHAPYRTRYEWGYVASALEIEGKNEAVCVFLPAVSKEASACFLQQIAATSAESLHVVIQDQAGFHLRATDEAVPANVRLLPLPAYSPELNPAERVGDLIKDATGNRVFDSLQKLEAAIETELKPLWTTPQRVRSLVGDGWIRVQVNAFSN